MEIFAKLGIDWKLFLAQLVNFAILLFFLHRFLYRPIVQLLEKRSALIEKSLQEARAISERMADTEKLSTEILVRARKDASLLIEQTEKDLEEKRSAMLVKTKKEIADVIAHAREKIEAEKTQMLSDVRAESALVIVEATKALMRDIVDKKVSEELARKALQKVRV